MSEDKYQLDLTGRPLEGYKTEEAAASLARLLKIPRKHARTLLRGKPSRIKRRLEKDKALHLMSKIIACGVQCEITQAIILDGAPETETDIELPDKLELEIDQLETEPTEKPAEAEAQPQKEVVEDDQTPTQFDSLILQAESGVSAAGGGGTQFDQIQPTRDINEGTDETAVSGVSGRQRKLLYAAAVLAVLGLAAWAGLSFIGGSEPQSKKEIALKPPAEKMSPTVLSNTAKTKQRLQSLARSVRIWMIQYGAGFDPSQVTMNRMQQDLEISQEEMKDAWGSPFQYSSSAGDYTITSAGPDRIFGNEDDITEKKSAR